MAGALTALVLFRFASTDSILTLARTEGMLFKFGSGTGTNLSPIWVLTETALSDALGAIRERSRIGRHIISKEVRHGVFGDAPNASEAGRVWGLFRWHIRRNEK